MKRGALGRLLRVLLVFGLAAGVVATLLHPRHGPHRKDDKGRTLRGVVSYVYDGDTVEVTGVGQVRLIGIDAMDGHNAERMLNQSRWYGLTTRQVEHWAREATDSVRAHLDGRGVVLHLTGSRKDSYGRTLAYVHLPGQQGEEDFGLRMVQEGLAAAYRDLFHPRRDGYLQAERAAQADRKGMWQDARVRP